MKHHTNHAPGHLGWAEALMEQGMGWMRALRWPRQASSRAQAPLFHNNKEPHWSTLRPCNPRGHRGPPAMDKWTQMLPANVERAPWGDEGGGVGGRGRKRGIPIFFPSCLRQLSVRFLHFLKTTDLRGLRARSIVGKLSERHLSLKENASSSKSLSPFLFLFLSSCHLDWEKEGGSERMMATFV